MSAPGKYRELPCQVYDVEHLPAAGRQGGRPVVRFRVAMQLSLAAHEEATVFLWNCPEAPAHVRPAEIQMRSDEQGTFIENSFYRIQLCPKSGQMFSWFDKRLSVELKYDDPRKLRPDLRVINRTPDVCREGKPWSHAFDWDPDEYETRALAGRIFCETIRWGKMHEVPEASARVRYRFYRDSPEVRIESSIRILKDFRAYALRNGSMSFSIGIFTHAAWPKQDGTIVRLPLTKARGNDMGAPPIANMPMSTPWIALYNAGKKYGMALITVKRAFFSERLHHPNRSRARAYVSDYRGISVYVMRSANQTYIAAIRCLPTRLHAGTVLYEEMVVVPFKLGNAQTPDLQEIRDRYQRLCKPLIVVP